MEHFEPRQALEKFLYQGAHFWNARRATHQHNFVNLLRPELCVLQSLLARSDSAVENRLNQPLELLPSNLALVVFAARQLDIELRRRLRYLSSCDPSGGCRCPFGKIGTLMSPDRSGSRRDRTDAHKNACLTPTIGLDLLYEQFALRRRRCDVADRGRTHRLGGG